MKKKVALIVQRYGEDIVGGAEGLARDLCHQMKDDWELTVLTSCAKDYRSWENAYDEGEDKDENVKIIRFPVQRPRDFEKYSALAPKTERSSFRIDFDQELRHFEEQGPLCPKLIEYLEHHRDHYDIFLFFTYLYYPTVRGVSKVADKAYLISTAHDEPPFYFVRTYAPLFHSLKGLIYLTEEEKELINRVYEIPPHIKQIPGGYGVPDPAKLTKNEQNELEKKFCEIISHPYFLYVGRASQSKRCHELVDAYCKLTDDYNIASKLVFGGLLDFDLPSNRSDIVNVGYLTEKEKSFLLSRATALINPSSLESLSMVILEAWRHNTPVIVNGESDVMKGHCDRSGAGLYYFSKPMLKGLMAWTYYNQKQARELAQKGLDYVMTEFQWPAIKKRLKEEVS